ncbi:pilus assembly protein TadG-related protein [Variovorax sp. PAMC 28711]|uniref:pilus assembly protein TadG-related protein n=1 Tax=Variovorax sp. PAMC 28711 TaxID=1795631 RepID=UPI00078B9564|nr:pilus assembly protein TadG-related protein [Variovorax sp. PAMC 28711]AMM24620.1 hypothetical protein AX767_09855 [Variovorax sp. PAMC 28711]
MNKLRLQWRCRISREKGQATFLALASLIFLTVMTLAVFNTQQASHAKQKTMNAADGAAYAAAATLARDMNYMAYSNRAMVANHVAVGQVVSLISLTQSVGSLASNSGTVLRVVGLIPGLQALQTLATALKRVDGLIDKLPPLMKPFIVFEESIIRVLATSQTIVRGVTVLDAQANLRDVVKANDPRASWDTSVGGALATAASLDAFIGYSGLQSGSTSLNRFREVVTDSRDPFTKERKWLLGGLFKGGTNMRDNNKTWTGLDGLEVPIPIPFARPLGVAWGGAETGTRTSNRGSQTYGGLARRTADRAFGARQNLGSTYSGLRPYFDLKNRARNDDAGQSGAIVVAVRKPLNDSGDLKSQLSDRALQTGQADSSFRLPTVRDHVVSVAASQVYFKRPNRRDEPVNDATHLRSAYYSANGEYASLFSPYWQARLTALPPSALLALEAFD